jgi:hypothetical protein
VYKQSAGFPNYLGNLIAHTVDVVIIITCDPISGTWFFFFSLLYYFRDRCEKDLNYWGGGEVGGGGVTPFPEHEIFYTTIILEPVWKRRKLLRERPGLECGLTTLHYLLEVPGGGLGLTHHGWYHLFHFVRSAPGSLPDFFLVFHVLFFWCRI